MYDILIAIVGNDKYHLLEAFVEDMAVTEGNTPDSKDAEAESVLNYAINHSSPACSNPIDLLHSSANLCSKWPLQR